MDGTQEDQLNNQSNLAILSAPIRAIVSVVFAIFFVSAAIPIYKAAYQRPEDAEHIHNLGLDSIAFWSIIAILFVNIPWLRVARVFSKVGPVEFQDALAEQNREHNAVLAPLELQVEELKNAVAELKHASGSAPTEVTRRDAESVMLEDELSQKIMEFFERYYGQFFNAPRIRNWGAKRKGFESLANWNTSQIDKRLRLLLAAGQIDTIVSKRGNTLYGLRAT